MTQHHQNKGGFGRANPVGYSPQNTEPPDTMPSDSQPPGVDEEDDMPQSLEEALLGE
jgi:hypothetical protein